MKVLVTGGTGHLGRSVTARLAAEGFSVRVVDNHPVQLEPATEVVPCDITDFNALSEQVKGQDAIVHLAAIPAPGAGLGHDIFRVNCTGTFNVYEAAAQAGIRRVVCASSINALGVSFSVNPFPVQYLPIDEDHPRRISDPYSFSKQITEEIAEYYWRRDGISGCCLRMPWVYRLDDTLRRNRQAFLVTFHTLLQRVQTMPPAERSAWVGEAMARFNARRAMRLHELTPQGLRPEPLVDPDDPFQILLYGFTDFWAMISVDDAAEAFLQALVAEVEGSHPLFITEGQNLLGIESETLAGLFYPDVNRRTRAIPGTSSLISYDRARQLIGFEPKDDILNLSNK